MPIEIALTIDDAPSIAAAGPVRFDPARMDAIRELLVAAGVSRCVAFVIGRHARGHERCLERWLAAGYELGNHSEEHAFASRGDRAAFTDSLRACDALLAAAGAFDGGRPRYFRFPYGDRGASPSARAALLAVCEQVGYTVADVSINLYDHCYEAPLARALELGQAQARAVEARFVASALSLVERAEHAGRRRFGPGHVHVAALHFGLVSQRALPALLAGLAPRARLVPLERAVGAPAYARFLADLSANGIIADQLAQPLDRALRKLARISRRADLFDQAALGPRWPHLAE